MLNEDVPVDYEDSTHTYTAGKIKYTSASQLSERFQEPFPEDAHIRYAEKHGNTPEYWKALWDVKNKRSRDRGDEIHEAEQIVGEGRMIQPFQGQLLQVISWAVTDGVPWFQRPDGVYQERKLWHHGLRIAGRADKVIITTHPTIKKVRYAHIEDYKTNEKLNMKSWCNPKTSKYKMMKPPIAYLMDCNWIHYCLQLSAYMLMLEYQGFTPGEMTIIWYPHPTEEDPSPKKQFLKVPYMKKEVLAMCTFINKLAA